MEKQRTKSRARVSTENTSQDTRKGGQAEKRTPEPSDGESVTSDGRSYGAKNQQRPSDGSTTSRENDVTETSHPEVGGSGVQAVTDDGGTNQLDPHHDEGTPAGEAKTQDQRASEHRLSLCEPHSRSRGKQCRGRRRKSDEHNKSKGADSARCNWSARTSPIKRRGKDRRRPTRQRWNQARILNDDGRWSSEISTPEHSSKICEKWAQNESKISGKQGREAERQTKAETPLCTRWSTGGGATDERNHNVPYNGARFKAKRRMGKKKNRSTGRKTILFPASNVKKSRPSVPKTTGQGQRKARQNTGNNGPLQGGQSDEIIQLISTCVLVM